MNGQRLRVGLVGCGQIADAHLAEICRHDGVELAAVCDADRDLAHQAALRFGVAAHFQDLQEMLGTARLDVLHVTTPPHTHASLALAAIDAGCHVYVEKPFTVDTLEAQQVVERAAKQGRLLCVGHDHLWDPVWLRFRELLRTSQIGDVVHVDSFLGYDLSGPFGSEVAADPGHWVNRLPGGLFHNSLSHALYKITDLIPDSTFDVEARWYSPVQDSAMPSELRVTLYGLRSSGSMVFSSAARPLQRRVLVLGTRCSVEVDFDAATLRLWRAASAPGPFGKLELPLRQALEALQSLGHNARAFSQARLHYFAGMRALMAAFYRSIREEGPPPIAPGEILRVTGLLDQIFAACSARATGPFPGLGSRT